MIKNYFITAWRNLKGHISHTLINVSGLTLGLSTAIMLLLWVQHERSYDQFHPNYQRIYRFTANFTDETVWPGVPGPLAVYARSVPEVEAAVRVLEWNGQVLANADRSTILDGFTTAYVDSSFFDIFHFNLIRGSKKLPDPNTVLLTASTAEKFFGQQDPLGQVIQFQGNALKVVGVLEDFPENSSLNYDAILPMSNYAARFTANGGNGQWKEIDGDLGSYSFLTFLKVRPNASAESLGNRFTEIYQKAQGQNKVSLSFKLRPLSDMHLVSIDGNTSGARMVQILMIIALLVLGIASVNYVNLTTAKALVRAREVGIRKVIGANKRQLFIQFMLETVLLFGIALLLALLLVFLLSPFYDHLTGRQLQLSIFDRTVWKVIAYTALGTLLASSIYPALLLAGFKPLAVIKGKMITGNHGALLRKLLVVFQFCISMVLIVATLVISRQMAYMQDLDLGYDKNYVLTVPLPPSAVQHIDAIKHQLAARTEITHVASAEIYDMTALGNSTGDLEWSGKPENSTFIVTTANIDQDFIPTMGIELLEGKNLTGTSADSNTYILNETAVKAMGLTPPYVGTPIHFHQQPGIIAGVVKDFNFQSLKTPIGPLILYNHWQGNILYVRTQANQATSVIQAVKQAYDPYAGDIPFEYHFIDAQFNARYQNDQRTGLLFNIFSGVAIFISCLGLLGLSTYTVRQRVKEIGIRKTLGASVGHIVGLLSSGSLLLIFIAILVGTPIAWWAMQQWLDDFAYRVEIQWWMFGVSGLSALLIALLTISWQTLRAALANPVDALKDE